MVSCLMGDSTALASAIVRCCLNTNDAKQMSHCEKPIPLENRDYYVVWDSAQLPVIKCNGKSILSSWDDVVAVAFDTRIVDAEKEQTFLIRG